MTPNTKLFAPEKILNPRDLEILKVSTDKIEKLIATHPFSKNIRFLFENRDLASKPVRNKYNKISAPNCVGTTLFVAGVSKLKYPYHGYDIELNEHMKNPAYNGNVIPGVFNFSYSVEQDDWHTGIYLGNLSDKMVFFAQAGHGGNFCIESLRNYINPHFYIPRTLVK